jgi:hypothetical protein
MIPGVDEHKSGHRFHGHPQRAQLRDGLLGILASTRIGLLVMPSSRREALGQEAIRAAEKFLRENGIAGRQTMYFDEGLFPSPNSGHRAVAGTALDSHTLMFEQDSRKVPGIQLADLAAHVCATMLLEHMGLVDKVLPAGENSGYDPNEMFAIGYHFWAAIRYALLSRPIKQEKDDEPNPFVDVASCGLYVDPNCGEELQDAAISRFGVNYLGCIH